MGAELSKNLALAGVGHLTVLDDRTYVAGDLSHGNFLVSASTQPGTPLAEATAASLQEMNPFIEVKGVSGRIDDTDKGAAFVEGFELVIAIGYGLKEAIQIDEWCSKAAKGPIKFFYARYVSCSFLNHSVDSIVPLGLQRSSPHLIWMKDFFCNRSTS